MTDERDGNGRPSVVLVADDDQDDVLLLTDSLTAAGLSCDLRHVADGEALTDYLWRRGAYEAVDTAPHPDLVFLDLNMPKKDGREALREIRDDPRLRGLPVVVLSTSSDRHDIDECYALGATSYFVKPHEYSRWVALMRAVRTYWFEFASRPTA